MSPMLRNRPPVRHIVRLISGGHQEPLPSSEWGSKPPSVKLLGQIAMLNA
jgi:hypothetical protein